MTDASVRAPGERAIGRYERLQNCKLPRLQRRMQNDPDPLDMTPELEVLRTMAAVQTARLQKLLGPKKSSGKGSQDAKDKTADEETLTPDQITAEVFKLSRMMAEVGRMVERIIRLRPGPSAAETDQSLRRVGEQVVEAVEAIVGDPLLRGQLVGEILVRLREATDDDSELRSATARPHGPARLKRHRGPDGRFIRAPLPADAGDL